MWSKVWLFCGLLYGDDVVKAILSYNQVFTAGSSEKLELALTSCEASHSGVVHRQCETDLQNINRLIASVMEATQD